MMRHLRLLACILVSVLALASVAYRVTWDELLAAFFQYKPLPLLLLLVYTFLIRVPPALRLQRLLPVSFPLALRTVILGCGLNNILPGRAGEVGRAHFLLREGRVTLPHAVRAIFWERLFDVNMLLLVSGVAALMFQPRTPDGASHAEPPATHKAASLAPDGSPDANSGVERDAGYGGRGIPASGERIPTDTGRNGMPLLGHGTIDLVRTLPADACMDGAGRIQGADGVPEGRGRGAIRFFRFPFLAGVLGVWVVLFLMYRHPRLGRWMVGLVPFERFRPARSLRLFGYRFLDHVRGDMTGRLALGVTLTTVLTWVGYLGTTWLAVRVVAGLGVPLEGVLLVFAVSHLTYVMPAAPGSIGLYEWAWVYALGQFGVPVADAFAAGLTCHMMQYIPMTIFSIAVLARSQMGLHLRGLTHPEEESVCQ